MRIAHVAGAGARPWTGVLHVVVHLTAALARRGHDVELWHLADWNDDAFAGQVEHLRAAGVERVRVPAPQRGRLGALLTGGVRLERSADLVHLHNVFAPVNSVFARALRCPYALSPHGGYDPVSLRRGRARKAVYGALFERRLLRGAALVCALSDAEARQVGRFGAQDPVVVIPNGVTPPPENVDPTAFRRQLGIGPDDKLAVFVGRLDVAHKGLDVLVRGIAQAPEWRLALVGPDHRNGLADLTRLAERLGTSRRLYFAGTRLGRDLHTALAAGDLFALTSRWEGFPVALLEALSHGTPALVSPPVERAVGVARAGAGWTADADAVGAVLSRLSRLDARAWAHRQAAAVRLSRDHDWDVIASRYEGAYERALSSVRR